MASNFDSASASAPASADKLYKPLHLRSSGDATSKDVSSQKSYASVAQHKTQEASDLVDFFTKIEETPAGRTLLEQDVTKEMRKFTMRQGFPLVLRLRLLVLHIICTAFHDEDVGIYTFGGFARELVRECFQKGTGYFESDLDIGFKEPKNALYQMKKKVIRWFQTLNLQFSLAQYATNVLSLSFEFDIDDTLYTVPVDFVFIEQSRTKCDYDVNNIGMCMTKFNTYSYASMLEASRNQSFTTKNKYGKTCTFSSILDMLCNMFNPHVTVKCINFIDTIKAIQAGVATLIHTTNGHDEPIHYEVDKLNLIAKWNLIRGPKMMDRGYTLGGQYPKCVEHTDEICPICQDDENTKYVELRCCNKVVHHECLFDYICSKRNYSFEKFTCFCCRQDSTVVMTDMYDKMNLSTSSNTVTLILDALELMCNDSRAPRIPERRRQDVNQYRQTRRAIDY